MHTEQINHDPAHTFMNTGTAIAGRPSAGSWLLYGLGSECEDLPGFVVLMSSGGGQDQPIAARQWRSGFLPSRFQGVQFQSSGDPVLYVRRPPGVSAASQSDVVQTVNALNRLHHDSVDDPEILTRISQYEMAFRMQTSVPGPDGHFRGTQRGSGDVRHPRRGRFVCRQLPVGAAIGRTRRAVRPTCIIAAGTITAASRTASRLSLKKWTGLAGH